MTAETEFDFNQLFQKMSIDLNLEHKPETREMKGESAGTSSHLKDTCIKEMKVHR